MQYTEALEKIRMGKSIPAYHGTGEVFDKFDLDRCAQAVIWFASDKKKIELAEAGASGHGVNLTLKVKMKNPAGWNEYEKYGLGELRGMKHDGVLLSDPDDDSFVGFVFKTSQIKIIKTEIVR